MLYDISIYILHMSIYILYIYICYTCTYHMRLYRYNINEIETNIHIWYICWFVVCLAYVFIHDMVTHMYSYINTYIRIYVYTNPCTSIHITYTYIEPIYYILHICIHTYDNTYAYDVHDIWDMTYNITHDVENVMQRISALHDINILQNRKV